MRNNVPSNGGRSRDSIVENLPTETPKWERAVTAVGVAKAPHRSPRPLLLRLQLLRAGARFLGHGLFSSVRLSRPSCRRPARLLAGAPSSGSGAQGRAGGGSRQLSAALGSSRQLSALPRRCPALRTLGSEILAVIGSRLKLGKGGTRGNQQSK